MFNLDYLMTGVRGILADRKRRNTVVVFGDQRIETQEQQKKRLKRENEIEQKAYNEAGLEGSPLVYSPQFIRKARQHRMLDGGVRERKETILDKAQDITKLPFADVGYWLGDINADIHAYSYGNLLGWTPAYQANMRKSGQRNQIFDAYWDRTENSTIKEAQDKDTLTYGETLSYTNHFLQYADDYTSISKANQKALEEGGSIIPLPSIPDTPEWRKWKSIVTGKKAAIKSPLFRTAREFQQGSETYMRLSQMSKEEQEDFAKMFPYDYDMAVRAKLTSEQGLPVPGEGMPALYRLIQGSLYNMSIASRLLEGMMHQLGMTSGTDVLGQTDNPIETAAGHIGGVIGIVAGGGLSAPAKATALAKMGTTQEFVDFMGKAKYLEYGGNNAPFALVDDVFGKLPVTKTGIPGFAIKMAQSNLVRRSVAGGLMGGTFEAAEGGDISEIGKAAMDTAAVTAGFELAGGLLGISGGLGWLTSRDDIVRRQSASELMPKVILATQAAQSINNKGGVRQAAKFAIAEPDNAAGTELRKALNTITEVAQSFEELNISRELDWGLGYRKPGAGLMNFISNAREGSVVLDKMSPAEYNKWEGDTQAIMNAFSRNSTLERMRYRLLSPVGSPSWEDYNLVQQTKQAASEKGITIKEYLAQEKAITAELKAMGKTPEGIQLVSDYMDAVANEADNRGMQVKDLFRDTETGHYPFLALGERLAQRAGLDPKVWGAKLAMVSPRLTAAMQSVEMGMEIVRVIEGKKTLRMGSPAEYQLTSELKMQRAMNIENIKARINALDREIEAGATATYKGASLVNDPQVGWVLRREAGHKTPRRGLWTAPEKWQEWQGKKHYATAKAPEYLIRMKEQRDNLALQLKDMETDGIHLPSNILSYRYPELDPFGRFKKGDAIGTAYSELIDQIENPMARALMRGLMGTIVGWEKPKKGLSLASLGLMGDYTGEMTKRLQSELTAVVDDFSASVHSRAAGGERVDFAKALLLPGRHPYDVIGTAFNSDLPFLLAKELTTQRDAAINYTLQRFAEVYKKHGKANAAKAFALMVWEKPIPNELKAVAEDITRVNDFLAQFIKGARYRENYATRIREGVTTGSYKTKLGKIGNDDIEVTYNTPWKLRRASTEDEVLRETGNTLITYVTSIWDEFYGTGVAEMFNHLYGTPSRKIGTNETNQGLDDLRSYLVKLIKADVLNRPSESSKFWRTFNQAADQVVALRYASDLVGNVNTHLKNAVQPLLTAAMTGGLSNYISTMPYKFHPEMKSLFNDYQHLMVSNYFADILRETKEYEAFGSKQDWTQKFMEWAASSYQWLEVNNRAMAFTNSLGYHLSKGWIPEEAIPRAVMDVHRSQFMYGRMGSPMLLRENALARMVFQYSFQYRYMDMAKRALDDKQYNKSIQLALSACIIDYALAPILFHDEVYLGSGRRLLQGEGGQEDLDDLLFGGLSLGGAKELIPLQSAYPNLSAKSLDLSAYNPGAKPLFQALQKASSSLTGGEGWLGEIGRAADMFVSFAGGNPDLEAWKPIMASDSIYGSVIPARAAASRIMGTLSREYSSINGETYLRAYNDDYSRHNIIAALSPQEELSMLLFGGTPEVDRYWRLRGMEIDADKAGQQATNELKPLYRKALVDRLAKNDTGAGAEFDTAMREAMTTRWGRVSEDSITAMMKDTQIIGSALEQAIGQYKVKVFTGEGDKAYLQMLKKWHSEVIKQEKNEKIKGIPPSTRGLFKDISDKWNVRMFQD